MLDIVLGRQAVGHEHDHVAFGPHLDGASVPVCADAVPASSCNGGRAGALLLKRSACP